MLGPAMLWFQGSLTCVPLSETAATKAIDVTRLLD